MTKKEIVRTISEEIGLTQLQTKEIVQKTFDAIVKALVTEKRIELRDFGVVEVKRRAPRKARNRRTGDKVVGPEEVGSRYATSWRARRTAPIHRSLRHRRWRARRAR